MAYELSFKGVRNWIDTAEYVANSNHMWATEEEEFLGEVGYDVQDGLFTEEELNELSQPMGLDAFASMVCNMRQRKEGTDACSA